MQHPSGPHPGAKRHRRPPCRRVQLEALEQRLPPGDVLLGTALGSSWFVLSLGGMPPEPLVAQAARAPDAGALHRAAPPPAPGGEALTSARARQGEQGGPEGGTARTPATPTPVERDTGN